MEAENYWVYQTTVTYYDGAVEVFPHLDSVWIEAETTIVNGKQSWVQRGTVGGMSTLRDSADYVFLRHGDLEQIIYSTNRDTLFHWSPISFTIMTDIDETVVVPAGELRSSNCITLIKKDPSVSHSDLPSFDKNTYIWEQYICSPDVGLIKHVYYYLGGTVEIELVRYKVK